MCAPKATAGLNMVNLALWNKAAITKYTWELANKKDKLWIKWIHSYYIKDQVFYTMGVPQQSSWMLKKIFEARANLAGITADRGDAKGSMEGAMYQNQARPKAIFILLLLMHGRLQTADRLKKWKIQVDEICCFCKLALETKEHLFAECVYGRDLWNMLMQWIQMQVSLPSWAEWQQWIIQKTKGRSQMARILKMIVAEYVYTLWIERNARIFEKTATTWDILAKKVACVKVVSPRAELEQSSIRANDSSDESIEKTVELDKAVKARMASLARMAASEEVIRVLGSGRARRSNVNLREEAEC
ncbi:PREDICTED: uncharacterized protein LOC109233569 [Nicotiana attenuata]|uniref:uncharacterized protein LOC109233569 n=1 Tax=Nicotiana attenuata TaxID=49451 RepID=UPI000904F54A|nr:PREDICTED: uncharacterized protein LOC109233569 [Nicotiana attenuata]